jgi:hypothetical protein
MASCFTSTYLNENRYGPAFVCGSSAFSEPAYVYASSFKDIDSTKQIWENSMVPDEPGKILFDTKDSLGQDLQPSEIFCNYGTILKALAAIDPPHLYQNNPDNQFAEAEEPQQRDRKRRRQRRAVLLIATTLNDLQSEDPEKIVIVRKINRLGFDSADILKKHFEQYGAVDKVRLSNAHRKEKGRYSFQVRLRPSGIGFVVFQDAKVAAQVLAEGETRMIHGVEVRMRPFERRRFDSSSSVSNEMKDDAEETDCEWPPLR